MQCVPLQARLTTYSQTILVGQARRGTIDFGSIIKLDIQPYPLFE